MYILFKTTVNKYEKNTRLNEKIIYSKNSNTYMNSVSKSKKMIRQWLSDLKYSTAKFGKIIMWNGMLTVHFQNLLTDWHVLLTLVYIILFVVFIYLFLFFFITALLCFQFSFIFFSKCYSSMYLCRSEKPCTFWIVYFLILFRYLFFLIYVSFSTW